MLQVIIHNVLVLVFGYGVFQMFVPEDKFQQFCGLVMVVYCLSLVAIDLLRKSVKQMCISIRWRYEK